jgi:HlyD family secretion protein
MSRTAAILLALLAGACGRDDGGDRITASGHVEATEVRVATKVPGIIEAVRVLEGDRVAAGQEIARLDTTDTRLAVDAARAEKRQADAELQLRVAGSRKEDIAEAAAQVERAQAELEGARKDRERMEALLASGSGTTKARDDARVREDAAAAALAGARERLARLRAGFRAEEIEAARARVAAAEAHIAQLEQQIRDAVIASPVAGLVTEKLAEAGELASRGTAIAVVTDLDQPWLNVYVGEPDLGRIRLGQEARVVTDDGQSRTGRVTFIASQAEFTPKNVQTRDERVKLVYRVKIGLPNADGLFKPGMPAQAEMAPAAGAPVAGGAR